MAQQASSWAESLNQYVHERSHAVPALPQGERFTRIKGNGRQQDRRQFNIVTGDAPGETADGRREQYRQQQVGLAAKAVEKTLSGKSARPVDIVTMQPRYGLTDADVAPTPVEPKKRKEPHKDSEKAFDLLTHNPRRGHEELAASCLSKEADDAAKPRRGPKARATNILTHEWVHDNEAKSAAEAKAAENRVERAMRKEAALNPLTQEFRDADQELEARAARAKEETHRREMVSQHTYQTSGIVKRSEGHAFDIVSNHVYNPDMVLALDKQEATGLLQRAGLRQQWEHRRDQEEQQRDVLMARSANRINPQRRFEGVDRGYDILSTQRFVDCDHSDNAAKPHLQEAERLLQKPSTMETLVRAAAPPVRSAPVSSEVFRPEGPRTSFERVLQKPASNPDAPGTFDGRRHLLLPTISKVKARAPNCGSSFV